MDYVPVAVCRPWPGMSRCLVMTIGCSPRPRQQTPLPRLLPANSPKHCCESDRPVKSPTYEPALIRPQTERQCMGKIPPRPPRASVGPALVVMVSVATINLLVAAMALGAPQAPASKVAAETADVTDRDREHWAFRHNRRP